MDIKGVCDDLYVEGRCHERNGVTLRHWTYELYGVDSDSVDTDEVCDCIDIARFAACRSSEIKESPEIFDVIDIEAFCRYHGLELKD
jgi:hypothetical protein